MSETAIETAQRVTVTAAGGVADVRLNRPEKRNALDPAMFEALVAAGERLMTQPGLRVVVLSGEGPDFCAGLDFASFQAMREGDRLSAAAQLPPSAGPTKVAGQRAAYVWAELPVPVIAAVRGNALGGGLQIALGADIHRRTRCPPVGVRGGVGPHPRYDRYPAAARTGRPGRGQGADLYSTDRQR